MDGKLTVRDGRDLGVFKIMSWSSHRGAAEMNQTRNHEVEGLIPGLAQRVNRELWCRLAAIAPIRPLAWEAPCAAGEALKRQKRPNKMK